MPPIAPLPFSTNEHRTRILVGYCLAMVLCSEEAVDRSPAGDFPDKKLDLFYAILSILFKETLPKPRRRRGRKGA